jgi:hypothetical protein
MSNHSSSAPAMVSEHAPTDPHYHCIDCGMDTQPGYLTGDQIRAAHAAGAGFDWTITASYEMYTLREIVWRRTGVPGWGGCLCVGCCEKRIGRRLRPKDFTPGHPFLWLPGTRRLLERQGRAREYSPGKAVTLHMDPDCVERTLNERAWRAFGCGSQNGPVTIPEALRGVVEIV